MQRTAMLVNVALGACVSHHSVVGPLVTDLRLTQTGIVVARCNVVEDTEDHTGAAVIGCVFTLGLLCGSSTTWTSSTVDCERHEETFELGGEP